MLFEIAEDLLYLGFLVVYCRCRFGWFSFLRCRLNDASGWGKRGEWLLNNYEGGLLGLLIDASL